MRFDGIPDPPELLSTIDPWIVLGLFGSAALAAGAWAIVLAIRERDPLPVVVTTALAARWRLGELAIADTARRGQNAAEPGSVETTRGAWKETG